MKETLTQREKYHHGSEQEEVWRHYNHLNMVNTIKTK